MNNTVPIESFKNEPIKQSNAKPGLYGSRGLSKEILEVCDAPIQFPEVNKKYIQAAALSRGRPGEADVRDAAGREFGARNGELEGQCLSLQGAVKVEQEGAERHCRELSARLEKSQPLINHESGGKPWSVSSIIFVIVLALTSVLGLGMGVNTIATVLMSSGLATFEVSWRAYCFSMVPILLAATIKAIGSLLEARHRRQYTLAICFTGAFFGFLWAASFSKTFPGFSQSAADIVQSLTSANPPASGQSANWMVFISILSESFLSAGIWLVIEAICASHQKNKVEECPFHESLQKELDKWCRVRNENQRLAGKLDGKINAIGEARKHFVEISVGHFHAALKLATNNELLNEFLKS